MTAIVFALLVITAAMSWRLVGRRPEHRPVAALLSVGVCTDVAQALLDAHVLAPFRASLGTTDPWSGFARGAGVVADGLALVWPAALVAAALVVFAGRRPWPAAAAWGLFLAAIAWLHPIAGDGGQDRALVAAQVAGVGSAGAIIVTSLIRKRPKWLDAGQFPLVLIVLTEAVALWPWGLGVTTHWGLVQVLHVVMLVAIISTTGRELWKPQPSP